MLSRAFEGQRRQHRRRARSPNPDKAEGRGSQRSSFSLSLPPSVHTDDDGEDPYWCGLACDLPLTFCSAGGLSSELGLREVLRSSVQVLGMSPMGVTEKVVLLDGSVFAAKRFRRVSVWRSEFGRRVELVAAVCGRCPYLVPVRAYLYTKRAKLVLCDYYPMGSLSDLLAAARELGHTMLDWHTRARIILQVARAVAYIHSQPPAPYTDVRFRTSFRTNVHGSIKPSNVFIGTDLSVRLSDYGFAQLAEPADSPSRQKKGSHQLTPRKAKLSRKADVYSFGMMVLEVVGGKRAPRHTHCIVEHMDEIRAGAVHFFECYVEGRAKAQAVMLLELALHCANQSPEARPSADQVLAVVTEALNSG